MEPIEWIRAAAALDMKLDEMMVVILGRSLGSGATAKQVMAIAPDAQSAIKRLKTKGLLPRGRFDVQQVMNMIEMGAETGLERKQEQKPKDGAHPVVQDLYERMGQPKVPGQWWSREIAFTRKMLQEYTTADLQQMLVDIFETKQGQEFYAPNCTTMQKVIKYGIALQVKRGHLQATVFVAESQREAEAAYKQACG